MKIIEKKSILIYKKSGDKNKPTIEVYETYEAAKEAALNKGIFNSECYEYTAARYIKILGRFTIIRDIFSNHPFGDFLVGLYA